MTWDVRDVFQIQLSSWSRSLFFSKQVLILSSQQHGIEGLGQVVLRAALNAFHDALDLIESRNHDDRDVMPCAVGL